MTKMSCKLFCDARGAAVIEMALIAPVLALGVIGIVDISNAYSRKLALEQGAQRAVEKIMQTTSYTTVESTLANEAICQVNGTTTTTTTSGGQTTTTTTCRTSPINASNVTVTWRLQCTASGGAVTNQTTTDSATFDTYVCPSGTASQAKYVQVALTDKYTPMFPIHFASLDADGTYHLAAVAGMRWK
jgi:Flp pilus assembly protein TadG